MRPPEMWGNFYGKRKWLDQMVPYQGGGEMIATVRFSGTTYPLPEKFEAGTQNINDLYVILLNLLFQHRVNLHFRMHQIQ